MNPAELLACITARAAPLERLPSANGRITQEDVLHSLGTIRHPGAVLLARVKFAGQQGFVKELDRMFWMAVVDMSVVECWPYPQKLKGSEFYRNLGRLALAETISPNTCPWCGGRARALQGTKIIVCDACDGFGRRRYSGRTRAEILGMPWETFRSPWASRYHRVQCLADSWESIALGGIAKRLRHTESA